MISHKDLLFDANILHIHMSCTLPVIKKKNTGIKSEYGLVLVLVRMFNLNLSGVDLVDNLLNDYRLSGPHLHAFLEKHLCCGEVKQIDSITDG